MQYSQSENQNRQKAESYRVHKSLLVIWVRDNSQKTDDRKSSKKELSHRKRNLSRSDGTGLGVFLCFACDWH